MIHIFWELGIYSSPSWEGTNVSMNSEDIIMFMPVLLKVLMQHIASLLKWNVISDKKKTAEHLPSESHSQFLLSVPSNTFSAEYTKLAG